MSIKKVAKVAGAVLDVIPGVSPVKSLFEGVINLFTKREITLKVKILTVLKKVLKAVLPIVRKDKKVEDWIIVLLEIALAIIIVLA